MTVSTLTRAQLVDQLEAAQRDLRIARRLCGFAAEQMAAGKRAQAARVLELVAR